MTKRGNNIHWVSDNYDKLVGLEILSVGRQQGEVALDKPDFVVFDVLPFKAVHLAR